MTGERKRSDINVIIGEIYVKFEVNYFLKTKF